MKASVHAVHSISVHCMGDFRCLSLEPDFTEHSSGR